MRNFSLIYKPFNVQEDTGVTFYRNFNSILRRDRQKNFLWPPRLWAGRRKEPILGYVPKNVEKKNLVHKGVKYRQNTVSAIIKLSVNDIHYYSRKYLSIPVIEFVSRFIIQLQFVYNSVAIRLSFFQIRWEKRQLLRHVKRKLIYLRASLDEKNKMCFLISFFHLKFIRSSKIFILVFKNFI